MFLEDLREENMINTTTKNIYSLVDIKKKVPFSYKQILSCKALKFLADLQINFNYRRLELLSIRNEKNVNLKGAGVDFFNFNKYNDREVKTFGLNQIDSLKKSISKNNSISALDFSSENNPSWPSLMETQLGLREIVDTNCRVFSIETEEPVDVAVKEVSIVFCGRDLSIDEVNFYIDKAPLSASFFDFGLYLYHNAKQLIESGSTPTVFIPNIMNYYEAKFWNEFLLFVEQELELETGSIKAVVALDGKLPEFEKRHIKEELFEHLVN